MLRLCKGRVWLNSDVRAKRKTASNDSPNDFFQPLATKSYLLERILPRFLKFSSKALLALLRTLRISQIYRGVFVVLAFTHFHYFSLLHPSSFGTFKYTRMCSRALCSYRFENKIVRSDGNCVLFPDNKHRNRYFR